MENKQVEHIKGILYKNKLFKNEITLELNYDKDADPDYDYFMNLNDYYCFATMGDEYGDLVLQIYRTKSKSLPRFIIDIQTHFESEQCFFAESLLDLNALLKELEPIINLTKFVHHENKSIQK